LRFDFVRVIHAHCSVAVFPDETAADGYGDADLQPLGGCDLRDCFLDLV
jgi:hypothetical protein